MVVVQKPFDLRGGFLNKHCSLFIMGLEAHIDDWSDDFIMTVENMVSSMVFKYDQIDKTIWLI